MDEVGGIVMLHIPRAGRLRDPVNLAQLVEIDRKYPRAKVIVAHVGRAYCPEDIGEAMSILKNTKNLMFDFSANTLDLAMEKCIEAVGTKRVMFGSDMPYTKMRMYRICESGNYVNVVPRGLYGDVSGDSHMRETDESDITLFMYEELLAFRRAALRLGLTQDDINDIMYNNASEYFGIEL
jgi:predicted TIM-barrel fold metal-dependent hydrolase